jgi:hypothetical protein
MGSSGRLPAKYAGRLRSDDGVGPLSAYAPRDGHEDHGQAAAAVAAPVTVLTVTGAYVEANPKDHYGGLHLTSHPPWRPTCC